MSDEKLTDFTDTSDVSDAAIDWVLREAGSPGWLAETVRTDAKSGYSADRARVLAARLIQRHHPELLVDPVDAIVREEIAKAYEANGLSMAASQCRAGVHDGGEIFASAKRLYLMGIEKGRSND